MKTVFVDTACNLHWMGRTWERIRGGAAQGRQVFVVCPVISSNKTEEGLEVGTGLSMVAKTTSMSTEGPLKRLRIRMVHDRQAAVEWDQTMRASIVGELGVLVSITVVEVRVGIPSTSVMTTLNTDRFGIAQLRQPRGGIGRSRHPGLYLLLAISAPDTLAAVDRLRVLVSSIDGFRLVGRGLEPRHEGDILRAAQSRVLSLKLLRVLGDRKAIK